MSHKETALCCGSLVMQKREDLLSFSNGPTFAVLDCLGFFHYSRTTQLLGQGMRNEAKGKTRLGNYSRLDINQSRGTRLRTTRKQNYAAILRTSQLQWKSRADPTATNKTKPKRLAQLHANAEASKFTAQITKITKTQRQLTIINIKEKVAFR